MKYGLRCRDKIKKQYKYFKKHMLNAGSPSGKFSFICTVDTVNVLYFSWRFMLQKLPSWGGGGGSQGAAPSPLLYM